MELGVSIGVLIGIGLVLAGLHDWYHGIHWSPFEPVPVDNDDTPYGAIDDYLGGDYD
ncbi:MAG: hypothetical protein KAJ19_22825 [Gammaproteobacteria bacterium]|nr:hypothetical protein [Gammaproteobacteria bacterium]